METCIKHVLAHKGCQVHSVPLGTSVRDAARRMDELQIGSVVVESAGHVIGILTERDLARHVFMPCCDVAETTVEHVMTSPLAYVTPETSVAEAMKVMSETHCRHLPVFAGQQLVGLISLGDLVRWATADLEDSVRYLTGYILHA